MSVLESATEAANRIIHGDDHSEDEVQLVSGELLQASARLDEYEEALRWIAAGRTGSYGSASKFAAAVLAGGTDG